MTGSPRPPTGLVLSAYNAAPAIDVRDPAAEAAYLAAVSTLPGVGGLEIPFYGDGLHRHDSAAFLAAVPQLPRHLDFTLTTIPDAMDSMARNPAVGLASTDPAGRREALRNASRAADAVRRLNDAAGRQAVIAVHIFSTPRRGAQGRGADAGALRASLAELAGFRWDGARLVLEHCDAAGGRGPGIKGFLPLHDEISASLAAGAGTGLAVNWARSVIEERDTAAPVRHARLALDAGILAGAVLSGCAAVGTARGAAWDDVHLPPATVAHGSLLTLARIRDFAAVLQPPGSPVPGVPPYRGLKVSAPPGATWQKRVAVVAASLAAARAAGWLASPA